MRDHVSGTVYLLHFTTPFKHARHYVGWTERDVAGRLAYHLRGSGSRLLRAVAAAGIEVHVAREWHDVDRYFERRLKAQKNTPRLCPVCTRKESHACPS